MDAVPAAWQTPFRGDNGQFGGLSEKVSAMPLERVES